MSRSQSRAKKSKPPRLVRAVTPAHEAFAVFVSIIGGQGVVSRLIDISQAQVSRIEHRKTTPGIKSAVGIEKFSGIPAGAWASGEAVDKNAVAKRALIARRKLETKKSAA